MFLSKPRKKPQWEPSLLADITDEDIDQLYFTQPSPNELTFPSNLDMRQYPYSRFALPTENDVRQAVTGENPEFGSEGRLKTAKEVMDWFIRGRPEKRGVREKLTDILERKTYLDDAGRLVWNSQ